MDDASDTRNSDADKGQGVGCHPVLSCCVIARDEAQNLPDLFQSVGRAVDEWIVVDTGSTDGTARVAEAHGARVSHFPWMNDFAAARNFALSRATGRWVLVLDADDRLRDGGRLRAFLADEPDADVIYLRVTSATARGQESGLQPRVFRRSAGVTYRYPVHEQPSVEGLVCALAPGEVLHVGYRDPVVQRQKALRNLALLQSIPETDVHRLYQELRTSMVLERWADVLRLAHRLLAEHPPIPPDARLAWSQALLATGKPQEAAAVLAAGLVDHPDHPDLFYALIQAGGIGFVGAACAALDAPDRDFGPMMSLHSLRPTVQALVGLGLLSPRALDRVERAQP